MADDASLFADPETSEEEIYRATWEALKRHGFADLSIQHIADESELGKSTIYHHFDGKDDLLSTFVGEFMEAHVDALMLELPTDDLPVLFHRSLDLFLLPEAPDGTTLESLVGDDINDVYLQLRAHAAANPAFRSAMGDADRVGLERLGNLIELGKEEGVFREDVDTARVAATLYAFVETALLVQGTSDETDWLQHLRASADEYAAGIVTEDVAWPPEYEPESA